jgi:membrane protease YdiL (CAAX protease family)
MSFAAVVVLGPVCEELVFRGVLFHRFAARWGIRRGLVVTGLLFGLLHGERAAGVLTFGLLMGLLYVRSGTLLLPVLCHTLNNGFAWSVQALDTGPHETFTLVTLQQAARPWVGVLAITAPFVLLYFAKRWPARDERLRWPEAPPAIAATG